MKIIVGKTAGTCYGVQRAIDEAMKELDKKGKLYCLGELVHNKQVTENLTKQGMTFIDNIEEAKNTVVIRAHGEPKSTYEKAKKMDVRIIDLTCPNVLKIHEIVEKFVLNDYYIFITGKNDHPETIGIVGFCNNKMFVIESEDDIEKGIEQFKKSNLDKALLVSQTTFNLEKFNKIGKILKTKLNNQLEIINTICSATRLRQEETNELSKQVDVMIIIGGKHSSNTNKLYDIAKENCKKVYFIETEKELNLELLKNEKNVGIMAGASTPKKSIKKVIEILKKL